MPQSTSRRVGDEGSTGGNLATGKRRGAARLRTSSHRFEGWLGGDGRSAAASRELWEAEVKEAGGAPRETLKARLANLRTRLQVYSVPARDGRYGMKVMSQQEDKEHFGEDEMGASGCCY